MQFGHPADAIRAGIAYVPGDRTDALLMQRSVRENIALPFSARLATGGRSTCGQERARSLGAIERLQIDTRAQREVQRLSGGNQQKVTIARWIAAGARTVLCFDPTRGIDVRTKQEIYRLLRELAAQGKSVLFYTSELEEVQLVCDRAIVIFGGTRGRRPAGRDRRRGGADARRLRPAARCEAAMSACWPALPAIRRARHDPLHLRRQGWVTGLFVLFALLFVVTKLIQPGYGAGDFGSLVRAVLPYAFAVAAQTIVVIAGGIDLSVASMMALTSVTAASLMDGASEEFALLVVPLVLSMGLVLGAINGVLIVVTRVPDIVVTLAMLFVLQGAALLVLEAPGGAAAEWLKALIVGTVPIPGVPTASPPGSRRR